MTYPILPALHGYSINKRPTFATSVRTARSGREVTRFQQTLPLWEFELRYEVLRDETQNSFPSTYFDNFTELQQIAGLFAACAGEFGLFYFEDTSDNSRSEQPLGLGDGVTTDFLLLRTISYGDIEYTEPVGGINLDHPIVVLVDDVPVPQIGNWSISSDLTTLIFDTAPGGTSTIKITFYYYYLCRFITNDAEFEEFMTNRWLQSGLRFRSVNLYASGRGVSGPPYTDPLTPPIPPPVPLLAPGKYYWECTTDVAGTDSSGGWGLLCGIAVDSAPLTGTVAVSINIPQGPGIAAIAWKALDPIPPANCAGWGSPSRLGGINGGAPLDVGEKMGFALDTINKKLWVRNVSRDIPVPGWAGDLDGGTSGDPATNVEGGSLVDMGLLGPLFVLCGASHGFGDNFGVGTVNLGQSSFTGPVPTGFVSILSASPGAALNPDDNSNLILTNGSRTFSGENVPVSFSPPIAGFSSNVGYTNSVRSNFAILQAA